MERKETDAEELKSFREARETFVRKCTGGLKSLDQFQCISDALLSVSLSHLPAESVSNKPLRCLFSGKRESIFYVSFIRLVERAPTLIGLHPNITTTPFYCVSQHWLLYLYGLHFLARFESLLYSAIGTEESKSILTQFLWCTKFLERCLAIPSVDVAKVS